MDDKKEVDIWSFSRLNWNCLYEFHQTYNLGKEGIENGWSQMGTFCHELAEAVGKGKMTTEEARVKYISEFNNAITKDFPKFPIDLKSHYYKKIYDWFERGAWWKGKVVAVEEKLLFSLPSGEMFQGYKDLTLEGPKIIDFKVSKPFAKKDLAKKRRQLDIYAYGEHQQNGEYPTHLIFDFFQRPNNPIILDFNYDEMMRSVEWAEKRIGIIKKFRKLSKSKLKPVGLWMPDREKLEEGGKRGFYCKNLCGYRDTCIFVDSEKFKEEEFDLSKYE